MTTVVLFSPTGCLTDMTKTEPPLIYKLPHRDWPRLPPWQQAALAETFEPVVESFLDVFRKRGPVAADEYLTRVAASLSESVKPAPLRVRVYSGSSKAKRKRSDSGSSNSAAESVGLDPDPLNPEVDAK